MLSSVIMHMNFTYSSIIIQDIQFTLCLDILFIVRWRPTWINNMIEQWVCSNKPVDWFMYGASNAVAKAWLKQKYLTFSSEVFILHMFLTICVPVDLLEQDLYNSWVSFYFYFIYFVFVISKCQEKLVLITVLFKILKLTLHVEMF